ncbi:MAG: hypothetical protein U1E59_05145 [Amaricoccus sp.]
MPVAGDDMVTPRPRRRRPRGGSGGSSDRDPDLDTLTISEIDGAAILPGGSVVLASGCA